MKIILAEVYAVGAEREGDVCAVVDDESRAVRARDGEGGLGLSVEVARREVLLAELDERRAAFAESRDLLGVREAGEAAAGDGGDLGKKDWHVGRRFS